MTARSHTSETGALGATIGSETARLCAERYAGQLRTVVLAGSLARDEGTWRTAGGISRALGDAEFLLVFTDRAPMPDVGDV